MQDQPPRISNRKFKLTMLTIGLLVAVPVTFKALEIDVQVTMVVVSFIAGSGAMYGLFNVISKKITSHE